MKCATAIIAACVRWLSRAASLASTCSASSGSEYQRADGKVTSGTGSGPGTDALKGVVESTALFKILRDEL